MWINIKIIVVSQESELRAFVVVNWFSFTCLFEEKQERWC